MKLQFPLVLLLVNFSLNHSFNMDPKKGREVLSCTCQELLAH